MTTKMNEILEKMNEKCDLANKALREKNMDAYNEARATLNTLTTDYAKEAKAEKLASFSAIESRQEQLEEILKHPTYTVVKISEEKNDAKILTSILVEDSVHTIKLEDAFKACGIDKKWKLKMEAFCFLMTCRMIQKISDGDATKAIDTCRKTYRVDIDKIAKAFDLGATPTSRNKLVAMMQKVVDEIIYIEASDDPENKPLNKFKVTTRNLDILEHLHLGGNKIKSDEDVMNLPAAKLTQFSQNFMQMLRNVITGDDYVVTYRTKEVK